MATKPNANQPTPWIKSDEIYLDTSKAPWMDIAKQELGKNIRELEANDAFIRSTRVALAAQVVQQQFNSALSKPLSLRSAGGGSPPTDRFRLMTKELVNPVPRLLGQMEAEKLREKNTEINKYFGGVKTDPTYDKKGRSFDIAPTYEAGGEGRITAWCAAFVNWCLTQAGAPHLGYATAKSWVDFGTPVAHPVYGCITIIKPSKSTGSTTGHVAFYVERVGDFVKLLGGNQGDKVSESKFRESSVIAYRWPTTINHYLAARTGVLA